MLINEDESEENEYKIFDFDKQIKPRIFGLVLLGTLEPRYRPKFHPHKLSC